MPERNISECQHKLLKNNCKKCGIYQHPEDPAIKTTQYDSFLNCSAHKYLTHMRKRQCQTLQSRDIAEPTFALLESICEKFQYGMETLALGLYVFAKACQKQIKDEKFWASASLMVASKGIQLDKRVPYLNRYQRYADKSFTQQDYELAQKSIFEEMGFDLQYTTFMSFLNFYLTNGVVFESDALPPSAIKHIEDEIMYKAKDAIRNAGFTAHEPEKFALSLIKETRIKYRLEPWKKQLEIISGFTASEIKTAQLSNALKPLSVFNNPSLKFKEKSLSMSLSQNSTSISLQNTTQVIEAKGKFTRKKVENNFKLQNLKENTMKGIQPGGLASFRNSAFSNSKYPHNISLSSSTERIIPLNSFISRRAEP